MPTVQFTEKELEDYLSTNQNLKKNLGLRFLVRQYRTPVGIVDIVAYNVITKRFVIIELKKGEIDYNAYFQMERYRHYFERKSMFMFEDLDMRRFYRRRDGNLFLRENFVKREFDCLLVGSSLSQQLDYTLQHWEKDCELNSEYRMWYTCFDYSFDKALQFNYFSVSQDKIAGVVYDV